MLDLRIPVSSIQEEETCDVQSGGSICGGEIQKDHGVTKLNRRILGTIFFPVLEVGWD